MNSYLPGYSFCIITINPDGFKLKREIESIKALKIPAHEIIVVVDTEHAGRLGALRNRGSRLARYDHLIIADDDLIFHEDFYTGLQRFGEDYDVISCRILNPDGSRFYDWRVYKNGRNYLLDYDQTDPDVAITGGFSIMKHWVFDKVPWNDQLDFFGREDVDLSKRLKAAQIRIGFNPYSTITHDAPYRQFGRVVVRQNWRGYVQLFRYVLGTLRDGLFGGGLFSGGGRR